MRRLREIERRRRSTVTLDEPSSNLENAITVQPEQGKVTVELKVKEGEVIDAADIDRCLEHTAKQIGA